MTLAPNPHCDARPWRRRDTDDRGTALKPVKYREKNCAVRRSPLSGRAALRRERARPPTAHADLARPAAAGTSDRTGSLVGLQFTTKFRH